MLAFSEILLVAQALVTNNQEIKILRGLEGSGLTRASSELPESIGVWSVDAASFESEALRFDVVRTRLGRDGNVEVALNGWMVHCRKRHGLDTPTTMPTPLLMTPRRRKMEDLP